MMIYSSQKNSSERSTKPLPSPEHVGLPVSDNFEQRIKMENQRNREYNDMLAKVLICAKQVLAPLSYFLLKTINLSNHNMMLSDH